jgi:hypothetical protein
MDYSCGSERRNKGKDKRKEKKKNPIEKAENIEAQILRVNLLLILQLFLESSLKLVGQ